MACLMAALSLWLYSYAAPGPPRTASARAWVRSIVVLGRSSSIRPILMVAFGACIFSGLLTFQSSLIAGTAAKASTIFAVYAVTVVAARLLIAGLMARLPQERLAGALLVSMILGVAAMFGVHLHPGFQIASAILTGIGYGLVYSVIQSWVVTATPQPYRHAALTWFVLSYFVGVFGFPVIGSWVLFHFGREVFLAILLAAALAELSLVPGLWDGLRPLAPVPQGRD